MIKVELLRDSEEAFWEQYNHVPLMTSKSLEPDQDNYTSIDNKLF